MISIIQSLELKWPFYVKNYMNVYSNIGGVSTQLISFDCLLQDYQIDTEAIYIQTILTIFLPILIMAISLMFLGIFLLKTHRSQKIRLIVIFIVISIFLQPSTLKLLFDNLTCKEIESVLYLKSNMAIECNSDSHQKWVSFFKQPLNKLINY